MKSYLYKCKLLAVVTFITKMGKTGNGVQDCVHLLGSDALLVLVLVQRWCSCCCKAACDGVLHVGITARHAVGCTLEAHGPALTAELFCAGGDIHPFSTQSAGAMALP